MVKITLGKQSMKIKQKIWVFLISLLLLSIVNLPSYAELIGNRFETEKYKYSINGENDWEPKEKAKRFQIKFSNPKTGTWVGVSAIPMESKLDTVELLAIDFIEAWDGWAYVAGRPLDGGESGRANADNGFQVMYTQNRLDSTGQRFKNIVLERYYQKNGFSYIVTAWTNDHVWFEDKDRIDAIIDSFRIN